MDTNTQTPNLEQPPVQDPVVQATSAPSAPAQMEPAFETLKRSWQLFVDNFRFYGTLSGLVVGAQLVWVLAVAGAAALWGRGNNVENISVGPALGLGAISLIFSIFFIAAILIAEIVMVDFTLRRPMAWSMRQMIHEASSKIWGFLGISLLTGLAVMAGFVLLVIPGIYLAIALSFGIYIYLDQGIGGTDALKKSREYVRGAWWAVFGRMLLLMAIIIVPSIFISAAFGEDSVMTSILNAAIGFVFTPVAAIYGVFIYEQLKKLKPGV